MKYFNYKLLGLLIFWTHICTLSAQTIYFNEAVNSNAVLQDEDGDFPDWFELYNSSNNTINLLNWTCTDDLSDPTKWTFPEVSMEQGGYLQVWASGKDRGGTQIFRTLVNLGDEFQYIAPNAPVNTQWKNLDFDDSDWGQGNSGFGYGDGDDNTGIIGGTMSVFLRKKFTITDPSQVESLILDMDYDDGFVAYINGQEVARANISDLNPAFNAGTLTDHEAQMYWGGIPERFLITDPSTLLYAGENVLSIQAHNINPSSSDFTIIPFLSAVYNGNTSDGIIPPAILAFEDISAYHTNFKLSSSGENLYLFDATGAFVDSLLIPNLPANVSIGYPAAQNNELQFFDQLTPGEVNPAIGYLGLSPASIEFSHQGGLVDPLLLTLSGVNSPAAIHYTLDASPPHVNSPVYSGPININTNTVVRAAVFQPEYLPSAPQTRTYIIGASHDLPILMLTANPPDFFDEDTGIYTFGDEAEPDYPYFGANFWQDWEKPIHFALYKADGTLEVDYDAGVKIFGGWSRAQEQRSLSLFARNQYGYGAFDYAFFEDRPYSSYQALVLRNSGNDWNNTMLRDAALTGLLQGADLEFQAYRPVVTYFNGEYWGIYNMREKVNEHFLADKWGVNPTDVDLLEGGGSPIYGDNTDYLNLLGFIGNEDISDPVNYAWVSDQIDLDNYALYQCAQIYFNNQDWPGNNIKFARHQGGKWRWILYDTDFGFGIWDDGDYVVNTLEFALEPNGPFWPNPAWATFLFRALTATTDFRNLFINRFADEMNSRFLPERLNEHIDSLAARIDQEIPAHFDRWGASSGNWWNRINGMKNFANQRQTHVKGHILDVFDLPAYHKLNVEISNLDEGWVQVNSLRIDVNDWEGDYFQNVPIQISAVARPGYVFSHWEGIPSSFTLPSIEINMQSFTTVRPVFEVSSNPNLVINEINYNSSDDFDTGDWVELYNQSNSNLDVSNWVMKDDNDDHIFEFPLGTVMSAEGFLILTRDQTNFLAFHPDVSHVIGDFDFGLSSGGDAVRLFDADGNLVDIVNYLPEAPWPVLPNGEGFTLELLSPDLDNSLPENWSPVNVNGSPDQENVSVSTLQQEDSSYQINSYPNPFTGWINTSLNLKESSEVDINVYDQNGRKVKVISLGSLASGVHSFSFDLTEFTAGIYFAKVFVNQNTPVTLKWVKI